MPATSPSRPRPKARRWKCSETVVARRGGRPHQTGEQLDLQALHRVRDRLVHRRTAVINHRFNFIMRSGRGCLYPIYKRRTTRGDAI